MPITDRHHSVSVSSQASRLNLLNNRYSHGSQSSSRPGSQTSRPASQCSHQESLCNPLVSQGFELQSQRCDMEPQSYQELPQRTQCESHSINSDEGSVREDSLSSPQISTKMPLLLESVERPDVFFNIDGQPSSMPSSEPPPPPCSRRQSARTYLSVRDNDVSGREYETPVSLSRRESPCQTSVVVLPESPVKSHRGDFSDVMRSCCPQGSMLVWAAAGALFLSLLSTSLMVMVLMGTLQLDSAHLPPSPAPDPRPACVPCSLLTDGPGVPPGFQLVKNQTVTLCCAGNVKELSTLLKSMTDKLSALDTQVKNISHQVDKLKHKVRR